MAKLLVKVEHERRRYVWEPFLQFCYHKSVDELAGIEQENDDHLYE